MIAAKALIDKGKRGLRVVEKERVTITADETVESCKLDGRKSLDPPWLYISVLHSRSWSDFVHKVFGLGSKH